MHALVTKQYSCRNAISGAVFAFVIGSRLLSVLSCVYHGQSKTLLQVNLQVYCRRQSVAVPEFSWVLTASYAQKAQRSTVCKDRACIWQGQSRLGTPDLTVWGVS